MSRGLNGTYLWLAHARPDFLRDPLRAPPPAPTGGPHGIAGHLPVFRGSRYEDPINGRTYRKFLSYGRADRTRPNALAPDTLSLERHRAVWMYLTEHSDLFTGGPGGRCSTWLRSTAS